MSETKKQDKPVLIWTRDHRHPCPNCGADERAVSRRDKWSERGDLLCDECGYAVGACAARCQRSRK